MEWAQVIVIVFPIILAVVVGIIYNNRRNDDLRSNMNERFANINQRFGDVNQRFVDLNQRFIDMNQRFADMNQRFVDMVKVSHKK